MLSPKNTPRILACLVLLTALVWLYRAPFYVSNLEPVPDATEYAASAQHIALWGKFEIVINGHSHPPRYPLWFPLFLLTPIYLIAPANLGAGIFSILACGLVSIYLVYLLGKRLGGATGGLLAALLLLSNLSFLQSAREIMSDVPAMMCGLLAAWLFVKTRTGETTKDLIWVSLVCGVGFAFRNLYAALLLPFLYALLQKRPLNLRKEGGRVALIGFGTLVFFIATALFNQSAFGDWRRTGYHYWCAIPYDYLLLTFSPRFLSRNLAAFITPEALAILAAGGVGLWLLRKNRPPEAASLLLFTGLAALPITFIHLFYFAGGFRFHLLLVGLLAILGGGGIGREIETRLPKLARFETLAAVLVIMMVAMPFIRKPEPTGRYEYVSAISQALPANAVLITDTDSVYLEPFCLRGTEREALPLTRHAEYASKVIVRKRVPILDPPPLSSVEHRAPALLRGGAEEALPHTASDLDYISAKLREGKPVFLDITTAPPSSPVVLALKTRFALERQEGGLLAKLEPLR